MPSAIRSSASVSSIATDAAGVIQIFHLGAERMLGYTAAEVVNRITPAELHDSQEMTARAAAPSREFSTRIAPESEALIVRAAREIAKPLAYKEFLAMVSAPLDAVPLGVVPA